MVAAADGLGNNAGNLMTTLTRRALLRASLAAAALPVIPRLRARAAQAGADRVVWLVIDGVRMSEWTGNDGGLLAPRFNNVLLPAGRLFTNLRVSTETWTYPAHETMLSGTPHLSPRTMQTEHVAPDLPTILEAYRAYANVPKDKARLVAGKMFFQGLASSLHASWGPDFGVSPNHGIREGRWLDSVVFGEVHRILDEDRPELVVINSGDVDEIAHIGDLDAYRAAVARADIFVHELWDRLQWDPAYAGRTLFLLTTDHGRHLDTTGQGAITHGDACAGCRTVFLYASGPGVPAGTVDEDPLDQIALAPTVARVLGFAMPMAWGPPVPERLLEPDAVPAPPVPDWTDAVGDDLTGDGYDDVTAHELLAHDGVFRIVFTARNGERWSVCTRSFVDPSAPDAIVTLLSDAELVACPQITADADGNLVVFALVYADSRWDWWRWRSSDGATWDAGAKLTIKTSVGDIHNQWFGRMVLVGTRFVLIATNLGGFAFIAREPEGGTGTWEAKYLGGSSRSTWQTVDAAIDPDDPDDGVLVFASRYRNEGADAGQTAWFGRVSRVLSGAYTEDPFDLETITEWNTEGSKPVEVRHPRLVSTSVGEVFCAWSERTYDLEWGAGFAVGDTFTGMGTPEWISFDATRPAFVRDDAGTHAVYLVHAPKQAGLSYQFRDDLSDEWLPATAIVGQGELCDEPQIARIDDTVVVTFRLWRDGQWRVRAEVL